MVNESTLHLEIRVNGSTLHLESMVNGWSRMNVFFITFRKNGEW